jgi:S1-C subfamily serine protease
MRRSIRPRTGMRRFRRQLLALVIAALVSSGVIAGVALAKSSAPRIGTGVVVIDTALGYESGSAAGTGIVLTSSGEVLTNNHVIRGATTIKIVVPGTTHTYKEKVVGYDVADDVAVLQAVGASNLATSTTAAASKVSVGDTVTAVGNAGGTGTLSTATGSITGLHQSVEVSNDQGGTVDFTGMLATNANVQPGDSGGPLLNSAGQVIGIDTAGSTEFAFRSGSETQAYAIPIAKVLSIAKQIEAGKSSTRIHIGGTPFLGIRVAGASGRGGFSASGAVVAGVLSGGPADSAGIAAGDLITAIDGHTVSSSSSVASVLLTKKPGGKVTVTYTDQSGGRQSAVVTLASGPPQ